MICVTHNFENGEVYGTDLRRCYLIPCGSRTQKRSNYSFLKCVVLLLLILLLLFNLLLRGALARVIGNSCAASERLIRDIMVVNQITRVDADPIVDQILGDAHKGLMMAKLPYRIGIAAALMAGFGSFPMCFDLNTTLWFNGGYVRPSRVTRRMMKTTQSLPPSRERGSGFLP